VDQSSYLVSERQPDYCRVGTYGRQLGQIADALIVLLRHSPDRANLAPEDGEAIEAFEKMANDIANLKEKHKRQAVRP
jgi:hypothetical protein